jgi:hypothetical protein
MIPASLSAAYSFWTASVAANRPLSKAGALTKAALVTTGASVVSQIETALGAAAGNLDGPDPTGFAGDLVQDLIDLSTSATDQTDLAALRGIAGRQLFNLSQA